jgi:flagellar biosynthesis protein FlhG
MKESIVISVGGGKGGVGKSSIVANCGALLAVDKKLTVGFIDADLGGANLHTCLGVKRPAGGLQDFLSGRTPELSDVAQSTAVPNSWLISGASDICELANPRYAQKQKLISHIRKLQADYVFVDLGAGASANVVDFFASFSYGVVVCDSMPASVENAYGFLKNAVMRGLVRLFPGRRDIRDCVLRFSDPRSSDGFATIEEALREMSGNFPAECARAREWLSNRRYFLALNMIRDNDDIAVGRKFAAMVKKYLHISLRYIGYVTAADEIRRAVRMRIPVMLNNPSPATRECFSAITENLYALTKGT